MIHVVTVVHDRFSITEKFVSRLLEQTERDVHLVLVDDGCSDGTPQMVRERMPESTVLSGDGNLWWGGGLHMAYRWLVSSDVPDSDDVLICNDDTSFDPGYLERGIQHLNETAHSMAVGTGYGARSGEKLDGLFYHSFRDGTGRFLGENQEGNCASTRSLFLKAGDWRRTGGFHPVLLPHYASDFEFTIRAHRKGIRLISYEDLTYTFDEGSTGDNEYDKLTLKKLFSKRSNSNPLYKLSFVILSTPPRYLPGHIAHQLGRYVKKIGIFLKIARK